MYVQPNVNIYLCTFTRTYPVMKISCCETTNKLNISITRAEIVTKAAADLRFESKLIATRTCIENNGMNNIQTII